MSSPPLWRRAWAAPLWAHACALGILLLVLMPMVGTYWQWSADEGAVLFQAQQLADGRGWLTPVPFPEVDPTGAHFPIHLSEEASNGEWAAYAKLPLYPVVVAGALSVGGITAVVALGVVAAWVAAWAGAAATDELRPGAGRPTLWALGLATPILFYAYSVIAHTLGAAAVAVCLLGCLRWWRTRRTAWLVAVVLGSALAVALRNEGILMAAAAVVVLAAVALVRRGRRPVVLAVAVAVPAACAFAVNRVWSKAILQGGGGIAPPSLNESSGFVTSRWSGFVHTTVDARGHGWLVLCTLVLAVLALLTRFRIGGGGTARALAVLVVALAALSLAVDGVGLVPGMALVSPVVVAGLLVLRGDDLDDGPARVMAGCWVLFVLAVLLAQYGVGGADEWGGRYFVLGLPLVVPVAVVALRRSVHGPQRAPGVALAAAAVGTSAVLALMAIGTLRDAHVLTDRVVSTVAGTVADTPAGDGGGPVVIATAPAIARLGWREVPDGRWLLVMEDDLSRPVEAEGVFRALDETDVDRVTVSVVPGYALPDPPGWQRGEVRLTDRGFGAVVYERAPVR